jgi:hypothetical protein
VLTTSDADTVGSGFGTANASFTSAFTFVPTQGADTATQGTISYALLLKASANVDTDEDQVLDHVDSGLKTSVGDAAIYLYSVGGVIVGSTSLTAPTGTEITDAATNANIVFTLSNSAGTVTLNQYQAIEHTAANGDDGAEDFTADGVFTDDVELLGNNLVALKATQTITDADGDTKTASAELDLGGNVKFTDVGPVVTDMVVNTAGAVVTDETNQLGVTVVGTASVFTGGVVTLGADGGTSDVSLKINTAATGFTTTVGGYAITLVADANDNNLVHGQYTDGTGTHDAFTVSISNTGVLSVTQFVAMVHPDPATLAGNPPDTSSYDEAITLGDTLSAVVTATDGDGDTMSANGVINDLIIGSAIRFEDDGPSFTLVNDGTDAGTTVNVMAPNAGITYGGINLVDWTYGADGAQGTPILSGISATSGTTPLATSSIILAGSSSPTTTVIELKDGTGALAGRLTLNADGTDSLEVLNRPATTVTDSLLSSSAVAGGPVGSKQVTTTSGLVVTITGDDGDGVTTVVNNQGNTVPDPGDAVNTSNGWAVDNGNIEAGEALKFGFSAPVSNFSFIVENFVGSPADSNLDGDLLGDVGLTIRVYYNADGSVFEDFTNVTRNENQSIEVSTLTGFGTQVGDVTYNTFYAVSILSDTTQDHNDGFRLDNVSVTRTTTTSAPDLEYNFTINLADADGDVVAQSYSVRLDGDTTTGSIVVEAIAGTSGADTLTGTGANDVLIGGGGDDTLTGGAGADVFKWSLADQGTNADPAVDTIKDFTLGLGGDQLDLRDILDQAENPVTLDAYLHFVEDGGNVVISVDTNGAVANGVTQTIILEGVTFAEINALPVTGAFTGEQELIAKLLQNDNLKTDM